MTGRIRIIIRETFSGKFNSLIVITAVTVSMTVFGIFGKAGEKFSDYIETRFASSVPPNTIRVSPPPARQFFMFNLKRDSSEIITADTLKQISKMEGVDKIDPVMPLKVPSMAVVSLFGLSYRIDLNVLGVSESLLDTDIKRADDRRLWRNPGDSGKLPAVVPRLIMNAYNEGMAEANNLPRITEDTAAGIRLRLIIGQSSIRKLDNHSEAAVSIAGFTDKINSLALLLPIDAVESYNRKFYPRTSTEYSSLFIKVKDHESLLQVSETLRKGKLRVETDKALSDNIIDLKKNVESVISLFNILIIALSAALVYFSGLISVFNRIEYYRLLRALGSSKLFITLMLSLKYALLGASGTFIGLEVLNFIFEKSAHLLRIEGISLVPEITEQFYKRMILFGISLPMLSILPALIRLYTKDLSRD